MPQVLEPSAPLKQQWVLRQSLSCMHGDPLGKGGLHWVTLQKVPTQQSAFVVQAPVLVQVVAQWLAPVQT